jgi:hypothetical protein
MYAAEFCVKKWETDGGRYTETDARAFQSYNT